MIPILYDYYERDFSTAGIGRLEECISCTVKEVINGEFECEFAYPITGKWFDRLVNLGCLIAVTHDHNGDIQPFEVYRYSAPIDGVVTFNAHHISYRLNNLIVGKTQDGDPYWFGLNPAQVFALIPQIALTPCEFTFEDYTNYEIPEDVSERKYFQADGRPSVRSGFLEGYNQEVTWQGSQALVNVFPGEFVWDKFTVRYYRKRGSNTGIQIRYGKNMSDVTREKDTGDIISAVFPYWTTLNDLGTIRIPVYVFGPRVDSPYSAIIYSEWIDANNGLQMTTPSGETYFFGAANVRATGIDFTDQFETEPTQEQLTQAALDWMSKNSTWRAFDNITIKFVDLYNSADYEDVRDIEKCSVGDYVDVIYTALGIVSKDVEIVSGTYDVLSDSFVEMELGEIKTTYADLIYKMMGGNKA